MKIDDNSGFEMPRITGPHAVTRSGAIFDLFALYSPSHTLRTVDQAHLSMAGQEIQRLIPAVKALPEVRQEKLESVAKRLQHNNWQVPVKDLAEAMFRLAELDQD